MGGGARGRAGWRGGLRRLRALREWTEAGTEIVPRDVKLRKGRAQRQKEREGTE